MSQNHAPEEAAAAADGGSAIPRHVAIIMDGNGRWAERQGVPRGAGHRAGAEALRKTLRAAVEQGVDYLTVYAFSSENWRRSEAEIADLTALMRYYLEREIASLEREGVRILMIGDIDAFGAELAARMRKAVERTRLNRRLTVVIALNYGARAEILAAARKIAEDKLDPAMIDEASFAALLSTACIPDPDLVIRTSGEVRLSNFLLWQAAYAELLFVDTLWPDFDGAAFADAVRIYGERQRRYGGR